MSLPADQHIVDRVRALFPAPPWAAASESGSAPAGPDPEMAIARGVADSSHPRTVGTTPVADPATGLRIHAWLRLDNRAELAAALGENVADLGGATGPGLNTSVGASTPVRVDASTTAPTGTPTSGAPTGSRRTTEPAATTTGTSATTGTRTAAEPPTHRFAEDAALVLAAYRRWGPDCVARLEGDFAFVIFDPRDGSAFAARDAVGIRPLYYALNSELFAASPSAAVFDLFGSVDTSVRPEWLADFIHGMSGDWRATPLAGVHRLPPGHWLRVTANEVVERRYHEFHPESVWEDTRDPAWLEAYRTELIRAVSVRTEPSGLIGVETSGGIDSSTILGVMAHAHPERIADIHTFGFALHEAEPEYILETSAAHGIAQNHIFTAGAPDPAGQQHAWRAIGYPTEHGNSVAHIPFYSLAAQLGATTLHSGHGGDETVTNVGNLALDELVARRQWAQVLGDLPGPKALRPARLAKLMLRRPGNTSHLTAPMMQRLSSTPLSAEVFDERDVARRTFQRARYAAPYSRVNDFVLGDRVSAMTMIRTADCSLVAASYGIDYRWALLDRRLIEQYLRTPAVWKFGEGYGRYLHRRAIAGMVPDKVAWKTSKYMGEAHTSWLRQQTAARAAERRAAGRGGAGGGAPSRTDVFVQQLHPLVRELIDPARVQMLMANAASGRDDAGSSANYLAKLRILSAWLDDRQGPA